MKKTHTLCPMPYQRKIIIRNVIKITTNSFSRLKKRNNLLFEHISFVLFSVTEEREFTKKKKKKKREEKKKRNNNASNNDRNMKLYYMI